MVAGSAFFSGGITGILNSFHDLIKQQRRLLQYIPVSFNTEC